MWSRRVLPNLFSLSWIFSPPLIRGLQIPSLSFLGPCSPVLECASGFSKLGEEFNSMDCSSPWSAFYCSSPAVDTALILVANVPNPEEHLQTTPSPRERSLVVLVTFRVQEVLITLALDRSGRSIVAMAALPPAEISPNPGGNMAANDALPWNAFTSSLTIKFLDLEGLSRVCMSLIRLSSATIHWPLNSCSISWSARGCSYISFSIWSMVVVAASVAAIL